MDSSKNIKKGVKCIPSTARNKPNELIVQAMKQPHGSNNKLSTVKPNKKVVEGYSNVRPYDSERNLNIKRTTKMSKFINDDMHHLTPPSEEVRLRDEDSYCDEEKRKADLIKRIKPKSAAPISTESGKRVSVTRKVAVDKNQETTRQKK